jgi:hypothetical protein
MEPEQLTTIQHYWRNRPAPIVAFSIDEKENQDAPPVIYPPEMPPRTSVSRPNRSSAQYRDGRVAVMALFMQ